jgi:hypothetical protein
MADLSRLVFDGVNVNGYDINGYLIISLMGVSGRPGLQAPVYQTIENHGTIPEGAYTIRKAEIDRNDEFEEWFLWDVVMGGGWGTARVSLHPTEQTETWARRLFPARKPLGERLG